jgi:FKBP12-rapamycin complex-associated protein
MFMHERYTEVCDQILSFKDHRDPLVRRAVVELIPTLASYNHADFAAHYLHKTMLYLLGQLKNNRDRTTCKSYSPIMQLSHSPVTSSISQPSTLSVTSQCKSSQLWLLTLILSSQV